MAIGIKPTVDFAFKKVFGTPQNSFALIGLLIAVLNFEHPVESVEVLNPFSYQEFSENKLIVLDVRCKDTAGRRLNVEMQVSKYSGLLERLVYYACSMYVDQLVVGQNYALAGSAISICLLDHHLFHDTAQAHHRFQMVDLQSGRELENAIEVHTVELTKYNLTESTISSASKLDQWVFLLLQAQNYDGRVLRELLPGREFSEAVATLEVIAAKTEDKQMYDQREKAQRDYEWAISGAREEGREEGREVGREEGREVGREEGRREGQLIGQVRLLQELIGDAVLESSELASLGLEKLTALEVDLKRRLRQRM